MSKIIDITNKLNFEDKPQFKIKDTIVEANNDAVTMLKVTAAFSDNSDPANLLEIYSLLFTEENRKKIESLKLDFKDFTTVITEIASQMIGAEDESEGEAQTPATT